jgi:hypothetical protein
MRQSSPVMTFRHRDEPQAKVMVKPDDTGAGRAVGPGAKRCISQACNLSDNAAPHTLPICVALGIIAARR